jgi:hypothetical protein
MRHPKAPPPKVVSIGPAREVTGGWSMADSRQRLAIGFVETLANGTVVFIDKAGNETELTAQEAREVDRAFGKCAWISIQRIEKISGFSAIRVSRDAGVVRVTHRGETHVMRLRHGRSRWPGSCDACHERNQVLWIAVNPPERKAYEANPERHFVHVCERCVDRLAATPKAGLREVAK